MNRIQLRFKKLHPEAKLPSYESAGAACMDLHVLGAEWVYPRQRQEGLVVFPGKAHIFDTGLAVEVPEGYALMIYSRSGHGFGHGIRLSNCVGVIDSDYRGPLRVRIHNDSGSNFIVKPNARIAQCMLVQVPRIVPVEVSELTPTIRGTGGFGSTGG